MKLKHLTNAVWEQEELQQAKLLSCGNCEWLDSIENCWFTSCVTGSGERLDLYQYPYWLLMHVFNIRVELVETGLRVAKNILHVICILHEITQFSTGFWFPSLTTWCKWKKLTFIGIKYKQRSSDVCFCSWNLPLSFLHSLKLSWTTLWSMNRAESILDSRRFYFQPE